LEGKAVTRPKLLAVKERLNKAGVPWAIFAGAAASCYGSRREVTDIDILVKREDLEKAKGALQDIDVKGFDIIASPRFFLDDEMIRRTNWKKVFGVVVPVTPVEDNIVFKAILQRGADQGKYDVEDIELMVKNEHLDLEYLWKRAKRWRAEKKATTLIQTMLQETRQNFERAEPGFNSTPA